MAYPLTWLYLAGFSWSLVLTVAVALRVPASRTKGWMVHSMVAVTLWALASMLANLEQTEAQMETLDHVFAPAWCLLPAFVLLGVLAYHGVASTLWGKILGAVFFLVACFCVVGEWTGIVTKHYIPAQLNGGMYDMVPGPGQLVVNGLYIVAFSFAAALLLWEARKRGSASLRRTASFFLLVALPAAVLGSWSSGGFQIVDWRPPYLDAMLAVGVVTALAFGMMRARIFTPLAEVERDLHAVERHLFGLLEISPDCVGVISLDGRFRRVNLPAAKIMGFESPEACLADGRIIDDFVPEAERGRLTEMRARMLAGEHTLRNIDLPLLQPDGSVIPADVSVRLLQGEDGLPDGFIASMRDQSVRLKAEAKAREIQGAMRQAQKLESLGLLASGIAHDFNNLLTVVIGSADLALVSAAGHPKIQENLRQTLRGAKHAAALTRELLVYSGKAKQVIGPVNLSGLVKEMGGLLEVAIPRGVSLETKLSGKVPLVEGDSTQLQQVILNLITNAAEACADPSTKVGGRVLLETVAETIGGQFGLDASSGEAVPAGHYLCLKVQDNGGGISDERLAQIFDPFFTTKRTGRGLGLSAVLGIVRDHAGYTVVKSKPGEGTTFIVLLPGGAAGQGQGAREGEGAKRSGGTSTAA